MSKVSQVRENLLYFRYVALDYFSLAEFCVSADNVRCDGVLTTRFVLSRSGMAKR